jgi:hypothetical protein
MRKERHSDNIPYRTIEAQYNPKLCFNPSCASGRPRIHCIAYSLINGLRDTIKEKIQVGDSSIDTLQWILPRGCVASMQGSGSGTTIEHHEI